MDKLKKPINKLILSIYLRNNLFIFSISSISLFIIFLNILLDVSSLGSIFQVMTLINTIFAVLFLPTYPLFFIIFKDKGFNYLEKLSITICANIAFYILLGYIGSILGIPITGSFYFISLLIIYFSLIVFIIVGEKRIELFLFLKSKNISFVKKQEFCNNFSIFTYLKRLIRLNSILLVLFLILFSILHSIRFSYFFGTDAMYHAFIMRLITELNFLPTNQYFGAMGLHLFGAVINFFCRVDHIYIAKYFLFYTFFISGLIYYNLLKRIFKNQNLAILGVFILETTSLGFSNMMYQYWPTNLATIQCLFIFFLLYVRLQKFSKLERPTKELMMSDLWFTYIFIILLTISALLTHSLISTIFIVAFFIILLIYFVRDYKRGIDLIVLSISIVIFLILYNTISISEHWSILAIFNLPWYLFLFGGMAGAFMLLYIRKHIHFTPGRFSLITTGKKYHYYKLIEDKIILPFFLLLLTIFSISFIIINIIFLDIHLSKIFVAIECFFVGFYSIWGLILFRNKPRGMPLVIWLLGMCAIFLGALANDIFVLNEFWSGRITLLMSPILIVGFVMYVYKTIKVGTINSYKVKIIIFIAIALTMLGHFSDQIFDVDSKEYSLYRREVNGVIWYSEHTSDKNFAICEFGWPYILHYYGYPYDENNQSILAGDLLFFIQAPKGYFKPSEHFYDNRTNKLHYMKHSSNMDLYLILDDNYLALSGWEIFERLTAAEMEAYYNLNYLNKIFSSKSEYGVEVPYYWVI